MAPTILVVEDDPGVASMVRLILEQAQYEVVICADGGDALRVFEETHPDLILLDVMLPGMSGIEICQRIRSTHGTPILMLTAREASEDIVAGLEAGADDYLTKPFDQNVLIARIRARLRPTSSTPSPRVRIGDVTIDIDGHEVRRGDELINLTPLEFSLLSVLAAKPSQVFTRDMLLEEVWGYQYKADTRLVNVHVQRLRSKVELDVDHPQIVTTVRGIGYRAGTVLPLP